MNNVSDSLDVNLNMISLNVKGLNCFKKRNKLITWLSRRSPDIILLQETFSVDIVERKWRCEWKDYSDMYFSHGSNHSKGVMILLKQDLDYDVKDCLIDKNGRFIMLDIVINDTAFVIVNAYAPTSNSPTDQAHFFTDINEMIQKFNSNGDKYVIVGGDMNILMDLCLDRYGGNPKFNHNVMDQVDNLLESHDLTDIWRVRNPNARQYTWRQNNPLIQSRLDYWFVSDILQDVISDINICPAICTDHAAICLKIRSNYNSIKGPSYWKFNNSLCDDSQYCSDLSKNTDTWISKYSDVDDARIIWELLKFEIRGFTQTYSKMIAKKRRDNIKALEDVLKNAEHNLCENPSNANKEVWESAKSNLETEYEYITQGIIVRSRAEWVEKGEKNSKYFLNLEKNNKAKSTIRNVIDTNGIEQHEPKKVLTVVKDFYSTLYTKKQVDLSCEKSKQFLNSPHIPKLSDVERKSCEGSLSIDECFTVLHTFKNDKAPGNDGLTARFYKTFWHLYGRFLVDSLNKSAECGELSNSHKQGVITLILKKGKDKRHVGNYRPITLLNVDLKIGSKVIASRINNVLPSLIGKEQAAFVKDRVIGDAVRTVSDILEFTKQTNLPGILLNFDFEKAYDSVDHDYLFKVLNAFNFGTSLQNWIRVFYQDISSCVMNNGLTTGYFNVNRGLRQGDPSSCYLFVLAIELLLISIRENVKILGIDINHDVQIKMSCYADDISCFVQDVNSGKRIIDTMADFQICSSMKVNYDKSEAMWIGKCRTNKHEPLPLCWTSCVKVLGIHFAYDDKLTLGLNYDSKLKCLNRVIALWKQRDLTPLGKITIMKTFGLSQFLYVSSIIGMPDAVQKKINAAIYKFIWNGTDKIKRAVLNSNYCDGGLKMINLKARIRTQKLMWIKRFISPIESGWKSILNHYLSAVGGPSFLKCNFNMSKVSITILPFYKDILSLWGSLTNVNPVAVDEILNQVIWNNQYILIGHRSVYYEHFDNAGFTKICDLFNPDGTQIKFEDTDLAQSKLLKWYGVMCAIPKEWVKLIKEKRDHHDAAAGIPNNDFGCYVNNNFIPLSDIKSHHFYHHFNAKEYIKPICSLKLKNFFKLTDQECSKLYELPFKVTLDTKLRWLQYRILHGILVTNSWLCKVGIKDSGKCTYCNQDESIVHLYSSCHVINMFWDNIVTNIDVMPKSLTAFEKLYAYNGKTNYILTNQLLIIARYCIYVCSRAGNVPSFVMFKNSIKMTMRIEEIIAISRDRLAFHMEKWEPVRDGV